MNTITFNPQAIDAVIVDLDGTMVDTLGDFVVALNQMLADLPAPYDRHTVNLAQVAQWVGKGSEHLIKTVLTHVSPPPHDLMVLAGSRYQHHYLAANGQHASVYPGVLAGLTQLQACGLPLACLTNKPTAFAQALLQAKGLDRFFKLTFGGDAFARKKPDPLPLLKTCEALGFLPARILMIGDSSNDAEAARAAGCPVLLVTYGYNHGQPIRAVDADGFTDSLQSLVENFPSSRH
ncbi:MAG: phosphoglycolate phosphatase [Rhodoferax sp.]